MNWGKWIVVVFVFFAGFIATLVVVCMKQDVSLVSSAYYQEDLNFQQTYDAMTNAQTLTTKPEVIMNESGFSVSYANFSLLERGTITVMRPSDKNEDQSFKLTTSSSHLVKLSDKQFEKGLYKIRLQWQEAGKDYRIDKTVVL